MMMIDWKYLQMLWDMEISQEDIARHFHYGMKDQLIAEGWG